MGKHRWSGFPGAFCLYCGKPCLIEIAIANGYFDPCTEEWDTEEHKNEYTDGPCEKTPDGVDPYSLPWPL